MTQPAPAPEDQGTNGSPRRRARPARAHKTAMTVAMQIVQEITDGAYPVGTKLVTEREMLEQYGVGRGTLRESLRFLEMNGVITMKPGPGGGPIVGQPDARDLGGTLGLFLQLHRTPFQAIVEVRQEIEPIIASLAAKHASPEAVDLIRQSVESMRANIEDEKLFLEANEEFHDLVAWASGNPVFALLLGSLHWITDGSALGVGYPLERRKDVLVAHERIFHAIADQDSEAARSTMARHIRGFERYLERYYPDMYGSELRWSDVAH